jgi:hypothetical protein
MRVVKDPNVVTVFRSVKLTPEAKAIFDAMGHAMRLAIPRDAASGLPSRLLWDRRWKIPESFQERDVPQIVVSELMKSGLISELTEFTENCKLGWREMDLPGEEYHLYACLQ